MKLPQQWMNHWFVRSMAGITGFRNPYDMHAGDPFTPYFQYNIGDFQSDYCLYFTEPPSKWEYTGEVFQKMYEYRGYDLIRYIEFHYEAYKDKEDFLRWLRYETLRELKQLRSYRFFFWIRFPRIKSRLQTTLAWVEEEEKRLKERPVAVAAPEPKDDPGEAGAAALLDKMEKEVVGLLHAHSGKIVLYNQYHAERLIQLLILLKDVQTGGKKRVQYTKQNHPGNITG